VATIGSITAVFGADTDGLKKGVDDSVKYYKTLKESIKEATEQLKQFNDVLAAQVKVASASLQKITASKTIDIGANASGVEKAIAVVEKLGKDISEKRPEIQVSADASKVQEEVTKASSSSKVEVKAEVNTEGMEEGAKRSAAFFDGFRSSAKAAFAASGEEALAGTQNFNVLRQAAVAAGSGIVGAYQGAAAAASTVNGAFEGVTKAVEDVGKTGQEGFKGFGQSFDSVIVATGRTVEAVLSVREVFEKTLPEAFLVSLGGIRAFSKELGGFGTVSRAIAGEVVAISTVAGSLASAIGGAAASIGTYAAVMGLARAATAGMSEEAREYVDRVASIAAVSASAYVGAQASAGAFRVVSAAVLNSSSATEAFGNVLSAVNQKVIAGASSARTLGTAFSILSNTVSALAAASEENTTAAGFAGLLARMAVTTAVTGAATGAITALAAGGSVLAGASAGAAASLATFGTTMIATAPLAIAAATATGKFYEKIKEISESVREIGQMADRFGATTQQIEQLQLAAKNTGVGMSQLAKGQQAFYTNIAKIKVGQLNVEKVREAKLAFDKLGLSVEELKSKKPEQIFAEVAEKVSAIKDPAERSAIAFDLFGKQGAMILPALKEFGELAEDFNRIGGALDTINFDRFKDAEKSFARLKAASNNLGTTLLVPFVDMQAALNNLSAEIKGGLVSALTPVATALADITKPIAVIIEVFARVINIVLRLVGAIGRIVIATQIFATIGELARAAGAGIEYLLTYVEAVVSMFESLASAVDRLFRPMLTGFKSTAGAAAAFVAVIIGTVASMKIMSAAFASTAVQGVISAAAIKLAWVGELAVLLAGAVGLMVALLAVLAASFISTAASAIASAATIHVAWLVALGPIGLAIGAVELLAAGFVALYALGGSVIGFFTSIGQSMGLIEVESEKSLNAATASVEELSEEAAKASKSGFAKDMEALGKAAGMSASEVAAEMKKAKAAVAAVVGQKRADLIFGVDVSEFEKSIGKARGELGDLVIESAHLGQEGSEAAIQATSGFNKLQEKLKTGAITTGEFDEQSKKLTDTLRKNLETMRDESPEATLKKNLELYKSLDDAVKSMGKSVRDISAGMQVGDKFFPASEEVKRRASEYEQSYILAIESIKKRQQGGGFAEDLKKRKAQNEADFAAGKISDKQFVAMELKLKATSPQDLANEAAEQAQRAIDRQKKKLEMDVSFAENIRKELETAFLSPVEKFEKELKKIQENKELSGEEKEMAEKKLRRDTRESLVGKSAQETLQERQRDIKQGAARGLINDNEAAFQAKKAMEDFAESVGVTKTPFEQFSSSLDGIADKFGMAGVPLDQVREKLKETPEQLALFDRAVKESRDNLLQSLGIEKTPQQVFDEQMQKIEEAVNAEDPNKRITKEQAAQATEAATRQRNEALGAGGDLAGQFADRDRKIKEAFGENGEKDPARFAAAQNNLAVDKREAAGLEATPTQKIQAGVDKINDAFGVTGKSLEEVRASLEPEEFKEYQEAIKKNSDAVRESMGVEKSGADKLAESREKLDKAVKDNIISDEERNKAIKEQRDSLLSSLGISKTPAEEFEATVEKLKENAAELSPDEMAKGLKEAKDKMLAALGIEKSPTQAFSETMSELSDAAMRGKISTDELAEGAQKAKDALLSSLGIPLDPAVQLGKRMADLEEALDSGVISTEEFARGEEEAKKQFLPGGEEESPVKKFTQDLKTLEAATASDLISPEEMAERKQRLQAQLQEDLKPSLDALAPDRRGVEASDVRSKAGVDAFFRILRGNDNPSLKAQLEIARNTKVLAEAANHPDAAPVIAQLPAR
jgi:hypothetical protein